MKKFILFLLLSFVWAAGAMAAPVSKAKAAEAKAKAAEVKAAEARAAELREAEARAAEAKAAEARAAEAKEAEARAFKHFSVSLSAVPRLQNSTNTSVPGESRISDRAYQYQFNFINQPSDYQKGVIGQKLDYISFRAFAYKHAFTDPSESAAYASGVGSVDGYAVLYGQRYLLSSTGYQGFGLGWYAGFAMINDTYVQKGINSVPITEKKNIPVVAAEIFYKFNLLPNVYIEPVVTVAYDNNAAGPVNVIPAIIVGGQF